MRDLVVAWPVKTMEGLGRELIAGHRWTKIWGPTGAAAPSRRTPREVGRQRHGPHDHQPEYLGRRTAGVKWFAGLCLISARSDRAAELELTKYLSRGCVM